MQSTTRTRSDVEKKERAIVEKEAWEALKKLQTQNGLSTRETAWTHLLAQCFDGTVS